MPKISIIVPVHNTEKYLRKCVDSILAQTYKNTEIILVENASTDNSPALCDTIAREDERIKVLHLELGDLSHARNEGIKASSGEFVGFIDSDDTIEPEMYEEMLELAVKENLDIVFCDFVKRYDYRSDRYLFDNSGKKTVATAKELLRLNFMDKIPQSACTLLARKKLFNGISFPVKQYYEDTATTWKLLLQAEKAGHIAHPFYHYYRHSGSIAHTANFKIHQHHVIADIERLEYINYSTEYNKEDIAILGAKPMEGFYRHFRKMVSLAKTAEEKDICHKCREWAIAISHKYNLRKKFSRFGRIIRNHWRIYCFLHRI